MPRACYFLILHRRNLAEALDSKTKAGVLKTANSQRKQSQLAHRTSRECIGLQRLNPSPPQGAGEHNPVSVLPSISSSTSHCVAEAKSRPSDFVGELPASQRRSPIPLGFRSRMDSHFLQGMRPERAAELVLDMSGVISRFRRHWRAGATVCPSERPGAKVRARSAYAAG